jgi:hypothetical protein
MINIVKSDSYHLCLPLFVVVCSTYSPVVSGSPRWWLDLVLCLVFAADYVNRIAVGAAEGQGMYWRMAVIAGIQHQTAD